MSSLLQLIGLFILVFGVSLIASFGLHSMRKPWRKKLEIEPNTMVRLVGAGGVYRCHYLSHDRKGVRVSSPIQRDHYIPLRVGEQMMVQVPQDAGLLVFRTTIIERDAESHEFLLGSPEAVRHIERRSEQRDSSVEGKGIEFNGEPATLIDISAGGAKVLTQVEVDPGDQVRIKLHANLGEAYGWALESTASQRDRRPARAVRVKFQIPLSGLRGIRARRYDLR